MPTLSARQVQTAKHPGKSRNGPILIGDGGGLYLQITPSGTKSWIYRFMLHGKSRNMGLGPCDANPSGITLAEARLRAAQAKALVRQGIDPIDARDAARDAEKAKYLETQSKGITFEQAARDFIAGQEAAWSNRKHRRQWLSTLQTYAYPIIGANPVSEIDAEAVEAVLKPIWQKVPETASRLRGRIEKVLDFAKAKGWRTGDNPADWKQSLKHRLPPSTKIRRTKHHPALPWKRLPEFLFALNAHSAITARAAEFLILTACRSGEVRGARWSEMDLDKAIWTIPAERMKNRREHRIPLSEPALKILTNLLPFKRGLESFVFPSEKASKQISDMALSMLVRRMNKARPNETPQWSDDKGRPVVPHGFRSTFRDWVEEATATPRSVVETALAHTIPDKVEAAYRRTDLFEKRRELMRAWAAYCSSSTQKN